MTDYKKWESIEASIPEDEEDKARRRLREQRDNMTGDEVKRLHECWEKPEFKAMFHEYAEEVSDPAHRAESEKYLAQCEAEQRAERDAKKGYLNGRDPSEFDSLSNSVPGQTFGGITYDDHGHITGVDASGTIPSNDLPAAGTTVDELGAVYVPTTDSNPVEVATDGALTHSEVGANGTYPKVVVDQYGGFNGAQDKYDWTYEGIKKMIVPAANDALADIAIEKTNAQ